ncbi:hypothetical protein VUR80DRAFT_6865 [Thermomyces stellatus]
MRASIILALASAAAASSVLKRTVGVVRRQGEAFDPDEIPFTGECSDLGPTYVECGPLLCIDPAAGESCCDNQWGCPSDTFCLVDDLCCPDGLDPETCAADNGVELPDDFGNTDEPTAGPTEEPTSAPTESGVEPEPTDDPVPEDPEPEGPSGQEPPVQGAASGNKAGILGAVVGLAAMAL